MKLYSFILLLGIASMQFLLTGCNDTPNSIGHGSQPSGDNNVVHIDTFYATSHSSDTNLLYTSSIDRFMLGQYKTYQAWACLKFYNWPDTLIGIGARITRATIQLKGMYHFGDSLAPLSFNMYRAKASFMGDSLLFDSLKFNSNFYYNSNPIPSQSVIPIGDTESITINILDLAMLQDWFSTNTDTTHLNDGLFFEPTNLNIIKGFYSFNASDTSLQPTLFLTYTDTLGNIFYYSHKVGLSKYISTVDRASLITDNSLMYVQNGISYRGLISFDSIPIPWPVSIYRTVLQVTLNSSKSSAQFTPFASDMMYALSVGANDKSDGASYAQSQRIDSSGRPIYSFEIRQIALRLLSNASLRKVLLSGYSESESFDLHALYGAVPDKKLKPRIIITYSVQR